MQRIELKKWAKEKIKGKWLQILGAILLVSIVSAAFAYPEISKENEQTMSIIIGIIKILGDMIVYILSIGLASYIVNFITDKEYKIEQIWSKFSNWKQIIVTYWHQLVMILLYTLLLIIPGIIKAISYSLVPYILLDESNMSSTEVLKLSEEMMKGHKMDYFVLILSFIGWHLLAVLTLGILEIWIIPYQQITTTKFLYDIKVNYEQKNKNNQTLAA